MLDHLETHAQTISVDQLVPIRMAADLAALPNEEPSRPAFFPADQVDRAVRWDIERAPLTTRPWPLEVISFGEWLRGIRPQSLRKNPFGGPRRPLLNFGRPCERTRRWYP
jgi:hypothetical protein